MEPASSLAAASRPDVVAWRTADHAATRATQLQQALVAQFGTSGQTESGRWRDADRLTVPCVRHPGKTEALSTLYNRLKAGHRLCAQCERASDEGKARREAANALRAVNAQSTNAVRWKTENAVLLAHKLQQFGLQLAQPEFTQAMDSLQLRCDRHAELGTFTLIRARLLVVATTTVCPHCQAESDWLKPWRQWAHDPQLRETVYRVRRGGSAWARDGGYLYRIVDAGSSRQYVGLTTLSLEVRWQGHVRDAKVSDKPLYVAMRERPQDFSIEGIAFYRTKADLQAAEKSYLAEHDLIWPHGYNVSTGGETSRCTPDTDILGYAKRHQLSASQVTHLLDWARWLPALGLTRASLGLRLTNDWAYDDAVGTPAAKDSAMELGGVRYASRHDVCEVIGLPMARVAPMASMAQASVPQMLEFLYHLKCACGPWRVDRWTAASLEELRTMVNIAPEKLYRANQEAGSVEHALLETVHKQGEVIQGVLHLSRTAACDAHGVQLQTVLGRMHRTQETFEQALLVLAAQVGARLKARRKVKRSSEPFVFRGKAYANVTAAAREYEVASSTLSYWLGRQPDAGLALQACLDRRAGVLKDAPRASGTKKVLVRSVLHEHSLAACEALGLDYDEFRQLRSRTRASREVLLEHMLRVAEGRTDTQLDEVAQALGLLEEPSSGGQPPADQVWLKRHAAVMRCLRLQVPLSRGLGHWAKTQQAAFTDNQLPAELALRWGELLQARNAEHFDVAA